ncbi:MAG TPA: mechanosensitive ion channel domain-containing protein [Bacteroidales bacterium]|nr:mechanosensitive ion channel domain-containing protein [Bacteroidales bacterium]
MRPAKISVIFVFLLVTTIISAPLIGQQTEDQDSLLSKRVIPLPEITREITQVNSMILGKQSILLPEDLKASLKSTVDTLRFRLSLLREDPRIQNIEMLNLRSLTNMSNDWSILNSRLLNEQSSITLRVQRLENERGILNSTLLLWRNTLLSARDSEAPELLINQVSGNIDAIEKLSNDIQSDNEFLQEKLVVISDALIFCNEVLQKLTDARALSSKQFIKINQPAIWKVDFRRDDRSIFTSERSLIDDTIFGMKDFISNYNFRLLLHLLLFLLILVLVSMLFRDLRSRLPEKDFREITTVRSIVLHPVPSALLVTFLLTYLIYDTIPDSIGLINMFLILIPVVVILYEILPQNTRRYIVIPAVASIMVQLHSLGYGENVFSRLFLLAIILFSLVSIIIIVRRRTFRDYAINKKLGKRLYFLALICISLLSIALISAIVGGVMLSEFITYATVKSAALILIFYAVGLTTNSIFFTLLYSKNMQKLNMVAHYHDDIYKKGSGIITFFTWTLWFIFTLRFFTIWDEIYTAVKNVLGYQIAVGKVELSLVNILVFILVIWITIVLSRLIRIIIEGELAPRVKMKRGVPGALSLVLRILVITVGFLFAIAAAGVEMDKLAILLGALGVGIGFGLQNIFNNLISGIILAFERPIQEGDIIEVGELWGTVKEIGIRASTIFTFDGAEVIVPNGNLISNELINWTLTDRNRRIEVTVGVKYGTDPEKVLKLLNEVVHSSDEVLLEPAPLVLFSGFGESSLDFRLLFWIHKADNRFQLQSKMNVAINRALKDAGIEIPFPQRDLHIRSVDPDVKKNLK